LVELMLTTCACGADVIRRASNSSVRYETRR
jgi:hypothetical protein